MNFTKETTAKDILAMIDEWSLNASYPEKRNLWDILSALRGPDSDNEELKERTTTVIRSKAFSNFGKECAWFAPRGVKIQMNGTEDQKHFIGHIKMAANALGIPVHPKEDDDETPAL